MASKRPNLTQRPSTSQAADQWVQNGSPPDPTNSDQPPTHSSAAATPPAVIGGPAPSAREATRRLTLDLPESLHRAMKIKAATTGVTMLDEVRALLEVHYGTAGSQSG